MPGAGPNVILKSQVKQKQQRQKAKKNATSLVFFCLVFTHFSFFFLSAAFCCLSLFISFRSLSLSSPYQLQRFGGDRGGRGGGRGGPVGRGGGGYGSHGEPRPQIPNFSAGAIPYQYPEEETDYELELQNQLADQPLQMSFPPKNTNNNSSSGDASSGGQNKALEVV